MTSETSNPSYSNIVADNGFFSQNIYSKKVVKML